MNTLQISFAPMPSNSLVELGTDSPPDVVFVTQGAVEGIDDVISHKSSRMWHDVLNENTL